MEGGQKRKRGSRLGLALGILIVSVISWYFSTRVEKNPVTGEEQRVALSVEQEIALGLQAVPEMTGQHGGMDSDESAQERLDGIGFLLVQKTVAGSSPYKFEFSLLADGRTINAFALPGGQIFITRALYDRLNDAQLAGVLAHEIGHVVGRHGAEALARAKLTEGLARAGEVALTDPDSASPDQKARMARVVGALITTKYSRENELESDDLSVRFMIKTGFRPEAMLEVMDILAEAGGGGVPVEFLSTHPPHGKRRDLIQAAIRKYGG